VNPWRPIIDAPVRVPLNVRFRENGRVWYAGNVMLIHGHWRRWGETSRLAPEAWRYQHVAEIRG
jgi:hypothetical protein